MANRKNSLDLAAAKNQVGRTKSYLEELRGDEGSERMLIDARALAEELNIAASVESKTLLARLRKKAEKFDYETDDDPFLSPKDHFEVNFHFTIIDSNQPTNMVKCKIFFSAPSQKSSASRFVSGLISWKFFTKSLSLNVGICLNICFETASFSVLLKRTVDYPSYKKYQSKVFIVLNIILLLLTRPFVKVFHFIQTY